MTASIGIVDPKTRARHVRVLPDGACPLLVSGSFVDVAFSSSRSDVVLALPREAVVEVRGAPMVFVAGAEPGSFTPRGVRLGLATSEDVAIEDGVGESERVAVSGTVLLKGELLRAELE